MPLSTAVQETVVGEGLAAGCLQLSISGITTTPLVLDGAFRRAWQTFPEASDLPAVRTALGRENIRRILSASSRRQSPAAAWKNEGAWLAPYIIYPDWTANEVTEQLAELHGIRAEHWLGLAAALVDDLGEKYIRRA